MGKIKPELFDAEQQPGIVVLHNSPHQGLIKANRFLLLLASSLMVIVFVLGFLLMPEQDMLADLKAKRNASAKAYALQNPAISEEINVLKGQLVGLISGSIESKLRTLESSIQKGRVSDSLGTIQDLKNDVKVLQAYSVPTKNDTGEIEKQALLQEVTQLKRLIYLTLTSCGLMFAAIAGLWIRKRKHLVEHDGSKVLGRK